jgi:hypothetical protein
MQELLNRYQNGETLTQDELKILLDALLKKQIWADATTIWKIGRDIKTYGVEQKIMTPTQSPQEIRAAEFRQKYPNIPENFDAASVVGAGWHLDYLFSDPVAFWRDAMDHWLSLQPGQEQLNYTQALRSMLFDSIPADYYQWMYNALDVDHVRFAVQNVFPEHGDILLFRELAGPDNIAETWLKWQIETVVDLKNKNQNEQADAWRNNVLDALKKYRPDIMENISTDTQAAFIHEMMPEVIDSVDAANIDTKLQNANAKTVMMAVGGITALVGVIALIGAAAKKKRPAGTVLIK